MALIMYDSECDETMKLTLTSHHRQQYYAYDEQSVFKEFCIGNIKSSVSNCVRNICGIILQ